MWSNTSFSSSELIVLDVCLLYQVLEKWTPLLSTYLCDFEVLNSLVSSSPWNGFSFPSTMLYVVAWLSVVSRNMRYIFPYFCEFQHSCQEIICILMACLWGLSLKDWSTFFVVCSLVFWLYYDMENFLLPICWTTCLLWSCIIIILGVKKEEKW